MNHNITLTSILIASTCLLTSCVSTQPMPTLTAQQCQQLDWQQVGFDDGANGRSANYFGEYVEADYLSVCRTIREVKDNRALWEQGRQEGLNEFCTPLNAYRIGRNGEPWPTVCPIAPGVEGEQHHNQLEEAFRQGRTDFLRSRPHYLYAPYAAPYYRPYFAPYPYTRHRHYAPYWSPFW